MASVKGANITNMDATPVVKVDSENAGGKMRVFHDTYEASSLASGSDITIARLPKDATIHDVVLKCDALGSGVTLNSKDSLLASAGQYAGVTVIKEATNTYYLIGNLA